MLPAIPDDLAELLRAFEFRRIPFETLVSRLAAAKIPESLHALSSSVAPGQARAVHALPKPGSGEEAALRAQGESMIARGELATVVLAGGMATRFGSTVKALARIFDDRDVRFIDAKQHDVARHGGGRVELALMTSFEHVRRVPQFVSLRVAPSGELFRDAAGRPSPHATGHGDLPEALATSGTLDRWKRQGVRTVLVSNVDNVAATVDPVVFAMHRSLGARITVELVDKKPGDRGGIPVNYDGRLVLAEAFRLPHGFPQDDFPMFNTNTLWIDLNALEGEMPWTWCVARKKVDGREAIQFERLVGELTWWQPSAYLRVEREGPASRFLPVKDLEELGRSRAAIEAVLAQRLGLN